MFFANRQQVGHSTAIAAVATALWLVHPMQLSAVLLVVQRMTLLSTTFVLAGLLAYVHGLLADTATPIKRGTWMAAGIVVGGVLGTLCKESAVLLPLYAWVIDATLLRTQTQALPKPLQVWRRLLLFPALLLVAAYLLYQLTNAFAAITTRDFTVAERFLTQPRMLWEYVANIVVPRYAHYGVYHDDLVASHGWLTPWTTLPALIGVCGALLLAFFQRRQRPLLAFAIFWFLGGHALESTTIPLELYFDHRNYLPMAGPIAAVVLAIAGLPAGKARQLAATGATLWMLACLLATTLYAQVWSSHQQMSYFWAQAHPASVRAQADYAQMQFEAGRLEKARTVLADAAQRRPDDVGLDLSLAVVDCRAGTLTAADIAALRERLTRARWSLFAYQTMAPLQAMAATRQCPALDDAAWLSLSDALLANPAYVADPGSRGALHYQRHSMAVARGDLPTAIHELDETAKVEFDPAIVRLQAKYLVDAGLPEEAILRLANYDPEQRSALRRWLVDDVAINHEAIAQIRAASAPPAAKGQ
jgi:protein O-mannosyl-transferase